jgi:hypothetical protein
LQKAVALGSDGWNSKPIQLAPDQVVAALNLESEDRLTVPRSRKAWLRWKRASGRNDLR